MRTLRNSLLMLLSVLTVSACGFHLAGHYEVPQALRQVKLEIPGQHPSDIRRHLNSLMAVNGIEVTDDAAYRLLIHDEQVRRRTLTITASADPVEYELIGTAYFSVLGADGEVLIDNREVRAERVFYNNVNTTAHDALEEQIRIALQEILAQQIVRQYLSLRNAH